MGAIEKLGIIDYRTKLARASWSIGWRAKTLFFTVHYNGPAVKAFGYPNGELSQLQFDARYHMRPNAFGAGVSGDGIQYHGATLSNGANYQLRDWSAMLWHCGNYEGNRASVSWHLPLGGNQQPTPAQRAGLRRVIDAFRLDYRIVVVNVRRHNEWKQTNCPGPYLTAFVNEYRAERAPLRPLEWFRTTVNANLRTMPSVTDPASRVVSVTPAGTVFGVDAILEDGDPYNGVATYAHRADDLGFYHLSVIEPA